MEKVKLNTIEEAIEDFKSGIFFFKQKTAYEMIW